MRRLALLGLLLALPVAAAPAEAAKRRACSSPGSKTVASNSFARVFEKGPRLYGCLRADRRKWRLAESFDDDYVSSFSYRDVRLAGRYVAWAWESVDVSCKAACPPDYETTKRGVEVADLRRHRTHATRADPLARSLRVSGGGGAAWAERDAGGAVTVFAFDGAGERPLDRGGVDPLSLRFTGSVLSWLKDGAAASAPVGRWPG